MLSALEVLPAMMRQRPPGLRRGMLRVPYQPEEVQELLLAVLREARGLYRHAVVPEGVQGILRRDVKLLTQQGII